MFAVMGALIRTASVDMPNEMIVFFRNLFALFFIIPIFIAKNSLHDIRTEKPLLHILRSAAGLCAMYCYFYALARMKLAEAVLLSYTSPLFIPLIALLWLRESIHRVVRFAVVIGFFGVVLILKPGLAIFQVVSVIALIAGVFASVAMTTIRKMSESEPPGRIVFYYTLLSTLISAIPIIWSWQTPRQPTLLVMLMVGFVAMIGQILMTRGYSAAPAARVGPFIYSTVVFATLIGWIFWDESLDIFSWIGAILVCIAGIIATRQADDHQTTGQRQKQTRD